jgi:hypothetical protein
VRIRNWIVRRVFGAVLSVFAFVARRERLAGLSRAIGRRAAGVVIRTKGIGRARDVAQLGALWQASFPSRKQVPIESVTDRTVHARIETPCPLAGTGDVAACHRMMAFDRAVVAHAGGQFVVLESQATPGVRHCRVAMRLAGEPIDDLVPAHLRPRARIDTDASPTP